MFGSEILEVAIGLILIYLLLSLVASAVREGIEGMVRGRAVFLERGIRGLLNDSKGEQLKQFYEHPLISVLYPKEYDAENNRWFGKNLPAYIPARNFAAALLDLMLHSDCFTAGEAKPANPVLSLDALRTSAQAIENEHLKRALVSAIDRAKNGIEDVQTNLEAWFDSAMDGVSGLYKRRTQLHLFIIAFGMTALLNVNSVTIARHLWRDDAAREALVRRAESVAQDTVYQRLARDTSENAADLRARYEDFSSLELPVGWHGLADPPERGGWATIDYWISHVLGLLLTTFAITLGAPFWFDTLNKIIVIRSTVKPREKSPEEASEDRQKPAKRSSAK